MNTTRRSLVVLALGLLAAALPLGAQSFQTYTYGTDYLASGTFTNNDLLLFESNASVGTATIDNEYRILLFNTATAGSATITNNYILTFYDDSTAGSASITNNNLLTFLDRSTAGSATITNNANLGFDTHATAGSATIINNGTLSFNDGSITDSASIINNGHIDIGRDASIGSLTGSGTMSIWNTGFFDGALRVGANNTSSTFSGVISDGYYVNGTGGSLIKIGTGTFNLTGASTYSYGTTISAGTLVANGGFAGPTSSLGRGFVIVESGGTLAGNNFLGDPVSGTTGILRFDGGLNLEGASVLDFKLSGATPTLLTMGSGARLFLPDLEGAAIIINLSDFGDFTAGTYDLLDWSNGFSEGLTLDDFALGSTIDGYDFSLAINGSELDLTATAIPEPSTCAALAGLAAIAFTLRRCRPSV